MLFVYAKKVSSEDRSRLMKIFGLLEFKESEIRIIDIEHEDVDCTNQDTIITLERETYKAVVRWFTSKGIYSSAQLLGSHIKDPSCKFLWYNFSHNVTEIMTDDAVKNRVWADLISFRNSYTEYGYSAPAIVDEVVSSITSDVITESEQAIVIEQPVPSLVPEEKINEVGAKVVDTTKGLTIDLNQFMIKVAESIDVSDPTLGKSLSLSEKIELNVPEVGKIFIYPTGDRIKSTDSTSAHLSFKDTLGLIRISNIFGADSITFHLKDANV